MQVDRKPTAIFGSFQHMLKESRPAQEIERVT